jgi:hypothetical protein
MTRETDPLTDEICDTMVSTILTLVPPVDLRAAQPRPDDRERAMDRRVFFDEPLMQILISSVDEPNRIFLEEAATRERARLPLFPAHFSGWDPDTQRFDPGSTKLDLGT